MSAQAMLRRVTGLNMSKSMVDRAIRQRMEQTGDVNRDLYLASLTPDELTELIELVVVPESWLFRDPQAFYAATEFIAARLAQAPSRTVRILSVPCAGGEEPYSMAMALCDAGVAPQAFTIDAYDLSPGCVARARSGVYGRNAFRAQDLAFRDRYFTQLDGDDYRIAEAIRAQVRFHQGNLLTLDTAIRARYYDVVFCRNLLIYFDKPTTAAAIDQLTKLLSDDGMLFAGYAEVPSFTRHGFVTLPYRQAFALRKQLERAPDAVLARFTAPAPASATPGVRARPAASAAAPASVPAPTLASLAQAAAARQAVRQAMQPAPAHGHAKADAKIGTQADTKAQAHTADPAALLAQARKLADLGQNQQAAAACQACIDRAPESAHAAEAYFILGMLSEHAQQPAQAEQHWRRCIYLQPDHYNALCHLALLAEQNGNASGAAALKARAARIYQRSQTQTAQPQR